jgi:hypothetical protein
MAPDLGCLVGFLSTRPTDMSRSQKRQKKRASKARTKSPKSPEEGGGPFYFHNPTSDLPPDALRSHVSEYARESEVKFKDYLAEVQELLRQVDPLSLMSQLAWYGLSGGLSQDGKISAWNSDKGFSQANVELVQALSLQLAPDEIGAGLVTPDHVQRCFDNLPKLSQAFAARRMAALGQQLSDQQKSISLLQEHLRAHTHIVRNWGYADAVKRMLNSLASYFDAEFLSQIGVSATQILKVFQYLLETSENRGNLRYRKLKEVFRRDTVEEAFRTYNILFGCDRSDEGDFILKTKRDKVGFEQLKFLLLTHSDLLLREVYTFAAGKIAEDLHMASEKVNYIMGEISFPLGALADKKPESMLLDNPIWMKPVIHIGDGQFFCPLPMVPFSFAFHILSAIAKKSQRLKRAYHAGKAKFLEDEIGRLFGKSFSGCEIRSSYEWRDGDKVFENDLLVRIDSHLLIIEAKSNSISWPALRGAPERAKRHIQEIILESSEQSWRLASRLREVLLRPELQAKLLPNFPLELQSVHTVLRLSVTLEDFAVIQTNQHLFDGTEWIPEGHRLAPCILLADLELVFEMLDSVAQKIHYLRRRSELAENMVILAEEISLLGFYFGTGFNIGLTEFGNDKLVLHGMSKAVDEYCMARAEGIVRDKPRLRLTSWWRSILSNIEERRFCGWTDIASILLNCSYEEQQKCEAMFAQLRSDIHRTYKDPKHLCSVSYIPHKHRSDALMLYGFKGGQKGRRCSIMEDLSEQAFEQVHVQRCLIIGTNIDDPPHPFTTINCLFRGDSASRTNLDVR